MFRPLLFFSIITLIINACSERTTLDPEPFDDSQYSYFPLQTGKYLIYQVDSIIYDFAPGGGTVRDSFRTFVKEIFADTLSDQTGQLNFTIE